MPLKYKIVMDFSKDLGDYFKKELKKLGYNVSDGKDPYEYGILYFNLALRKVAAVPRQVYYSKEFKCPPMYKKRLQKIVKKIKKGEDITPFLSRGLKNLTKDDMLLNDWGIYHLHLGKKIEDDGFVERTDPLLFVRFDDRNAYLIKIMEHGKWIDKELLQIIHENWPESIAQWRLPKGIDLTHDITEEHIKKFRKHGFTYFVKLDNGAVYAPIGMGYTSSGTSTSVVMTCNKYFNHVRLFEEQIKENIVEIIKDIKDDKRFNGIIEFELLVINERFFAREKNFGFVIPYVVR